MSDLYLKAPDEATMNAALIAAGLAYEEDGNLYPAPGVSIDTIGPIVRWDYSVEPPVSTEYPEWHVNIRSAFEVEGLDAFVIAPPEQPFRVWA